MLTRIALLLVLLPLTASFISAVSMPGSTRSANIPSIVMSISPHVHSQRLSAAATHQRHLQAMRDSYAEGVHEHYTSQEVSKLLSRPDLSVVLFGARYCRLCHLLMPRIKLLAAKHVGAVSRVNHCAATHAAFEEYAIQQLPTLLVRRPGQEDQLIPATLDSIRSLERMLMSEEVDDALPVFRA